MNTAQDINGRGNRLSIPLRRVSITFKIAKRVMKDILFALEKSRKLEAIFESAPTSQEAVRLAKLEMNIK